MLFIKGINIKSKYKSNASKVTAITIGFVLINIFMTYYNDSLLHSVLSSGITGLYNLKVSLLTGILTGLIAGILGGSVLVYVNDKYFRQQSYGYALKTTFLAYTVVFALITIIMSLLHTRIAVGPGVTFSDIFQGASIFMYSKMAFIFYFFWGSFSLLVVLFLQISDKFGPGMLFKFLIGTYHKPREEQRIFMFMDMRSSTTIAEKLGSNRYFNLLNDLFRDATDAILSTEGEIYQYVGDEVVISWKLEKGLKNANCLRCFGLVRKVLAENAPRYEKKYGVNPSFKAGVHYGQVTAGEVGSIKKDIVYSGDVLNTAARIQEQCNHYNVDFLISGDTLDQMVDLTSYELVHLGNIVLRGREQTIDLYSIKPADKVPVL